MGRSYLEVPGLVILLFVFVESAGAVDFARFPSPTNRTLSSVFMLHENDGWAVGNGGTIIRWNGTDWRYSISPTGYPLRSVSMASEDDGWIVGGYGTILRWNGSYWSIADSPTGWGIHSVSMVDSDEGWAVGYRGAILRWAGTSWRLGLSPTWDTLNSVDMLGENDGWAVGNKGTIVRWNGIKWSKVTGPTTSNLLSVSMASPVDGWAVGRAGTIVHWDGETWDAVASPTGVDLASIHMLSDSDGWAVGGDGTLIHWNGVAWELASSPTEVYITGVSMIDADNGWAVGSDGVLLRWTGDAREGRIAVDPSSLDFGAVPVDYPPQWNVTTITNAGTEPLRVDSVALTEDGMGVFSLLGSIRDGRFFASRGATIGQFPPSSGPGIGDPVPHLGPYVLAPGEYLHIWVSYHTVTSEVEEYNGAVEILSNDPFDPVFEVQLLASGTTCSMASTVTYVEIPVAKEEVTLPFGEPIHLNAIVVSLDVFREHNVEDFKVKASEDKRSITVGGKVKDPDYYAKVTMEILYTNSSEKLAVLDIIVPPYPAPDATVTSCDSSGNLVDDFDVGEAVYVTGKGHAPSAEHSIAIVPDSWFWLTGMDIRRLPGTVLKVSSDSDGVIPPTLIWDSPQTPGEYDIVLDLAGDGLYDGGIDPLDNSKKGSTGGFAVNELAILISALLLSSCLSHPRPD